MQWDNSPTAGFTSAHPWISIPPSASWINVAAQVQDPGSILSYYKALIDARHRIPALTDGTFDRIDVGDPALFTYCRRTSRSEVLVMVNLSGTARTPHFPSPTRRGRRHAGHCTWAMWTSRAQVVLLTGRTRKIVPCPHAHR